MCILEKDLIATDCLTHALVLEALWRNYSFILQAQLLCENLQALEGCLLKSYMADLHQDVFYWLKCHSSFIPVKDPCLQLRCWPQASQLPVTVSILLFVVLCLCLCRLQSRSWGPSQWIVGLAGEASVTDLAAQTTEWLCASLLSLLADLFWPLWRHYLYHSLGLGTTSVSAVLRTLQERVFRDWVQQLLGETNP